MSLMVSNTVNTAFDPCIAFTNSSHLAGSGELNKSLKLVITFDMTSGLKNGEFLDNHSIAFILSSISCSGDLIILIGVHAYSSV